MQQYINSDHYEKEIKFLLQQLEVKHILLVCGKTFHKLSFSIFVNSLNKKNGIAITYFEDFSPNPKYEDILRGVKKFEENNCDFILAVGGGSTIDVAKCIKFFERKRICKEYFRRDVIESNIPLFVIPTTAGTGSEATQFAVIYVNGKKYSVDHKNILPQYVLLHPDTLISLPSYEKKVALCDALSHAIESHWSIHSTVESIKFSEEAIKIILDNIEAYLDGDSKSYKSMLWASNLAGKAINMTKTTAAHAMSYKLTSLWGIPHGHAVILCLPEVWEFMRNNLEKCIDCRGRNYLQKNLDLLAECLRKRNQKEAIQFLKNLRSEFEFKFLEKIDKQVVDLLVNSVNAERLKNFPVALTKNDLNKIYQNALMENR